MKIEGIDLTLIYDAEKTTPSIALDNVNISVSEKEIVGIAGPSGSGKSSLMYVLAGLKKTSLGSVYYNGVDISSYSETTMNELRKKQIGFIFQNHYLISHLSLLENILMPIENKKPEDIERAMYFMEQLEIIDLKCRYPEELSMGERQKGAIIRGFMNQPDIIFADEPTAALDCEATVVVIELFEKIKLQKNTSVIVITHDKQVLRHADRTIYMRNGKIE